MCGKSFKKVGHIDCKIIAFEVKKRVFLTLCKTRSIDIESSWLKTFALYNLRLLMLYYEIELKIHKKIKTQKIFIFIL
jgi:hypothetical protein